MNALAGYDTLVSLLPPNLQPYGLVIVIGVSIVLALVLWPVIRLCLRAFWTLRLLLLLGAILAVTGIPGCSTGPKATKAAFVSGLAVGR